MGKKIDWDFIQSEYEETNKSIRGIASENDISEGAIRSKIKKYKWEQCSNSTEMTQMLVTKSRSIGGVATKKVREIIEILGVNYNPSYETMIVVFASNYEMWLEIKKELKEVGIISKTSKGTKQLSVEFIALKEIEKTLKEYASYIGISMSEAMKLALNTKPDTEDDSLDNIDDDVNSMDISI